MKKEIEKVLKQFVKVKPSKIKRGDQILYDKKVWTVVRKHRDGRITIANPIPLVVLAMIEKWREMIAKDIPYKKGIKPVEKR